MKSARQNNRKGFTIIELLVAMTVFLIVVAITSGIFIRTIRTQRIITNMSTSLNNATLALEQIAREARTGYMFYSPDEATLRFYNAQGEYIEYSLDTDPQTDRGQIQRGTVGGDRSPITSERTDVDRLHFEIKDGADPALVTVAVRASVEGNIKVDLQTSVSSRVIGI